MADFSLYDTPLPLLSITTPETLTFCKQFCDEKLPTVFISSVPKSGTTFMQCIVYNLLTKGNQVALQHISGFTPFLDNSRTFGEDGKLQLQYQANHEFMGAHAFNTHFLYHMLPHHVNMKYIYVIRDGKDVAVSFYHHLRNQDDADLFEGSFSEFLQQFLDGKLPYGSRISHIYSWLRAYQSFEQNIQSTGVESTNPILLVRYEDLISNLKEQVFRIISFLNLQYSDEEVDAVLPYMSFAYMKANKHKFEPVSVPWKEGFEFIRKGIAGDHMTMFSEEDHLLYQQRVAQELELAGDEDDPLIGTYCGRV
jgi:hypothetical protein